MHVSFGQRSIHAYKTTEPIVVDGFAKESTWTVAEKTDSMTQFTPKNGELSAVQTHIQLAYDDAAIFLFVQCFEDARHISKVFSPRDDFNSNTDNFQVIIDTYNDDLNGFSFGVSSTGTQYDSKIFQGTKTVDFNLVWKSAVHIVDDGWQIEMRIPYSALRFPIKEVQDWGINFSRQRSFLREESTWNPIDPSFDNLIAQCGTLKSLMGIKPPLRLALIPYSSCYLTRYSDDAKAINWSNSFNGGMDVKLGLNEAFTLDMTLVPDFGQVVFDNKVLNVTPFELQFNENRQFFAEGIELFTKSGLFYSRRVGVQAPTEVLKTQLNANESLKNVPTNIQLYNASKLSGRTNSGLGIGLFNAISAEQYGTAISKLDAKERAIILSPLTNYNVLVLDQNLKNNSYVNFTNTSVLREGNFYDANVSGLSAKFNSPSNKYFISGFGAVSVKHYNTQNNLGQSMNVNLGKQTGNFTCNYRYTLESNTYNPNDLGFNANNNKRNHDLTFGYRIFEPTKLFTRYGASLTFSYARLYVPNVFTFATLNGNSFFINRKFNGFGVSLNQSLVKGYDYFEPRTPGRYFIQPRWLEVGLWISSNYQKPFAIDMGIKPAFTSVKNWQFVTYNFSPRIRFSKRLFMVYNFEQQFSYNTRNYAVSFGKPLYAATGIIFGRRNENIITHSIDIAYSFTNKMSLKFRLRHYRSALTYKQFYELNQDGTLSETSMNGLDSLGKSVYNMNYNAFTIDCVYRWVFRPGSELNLVWKQSIFSNDLNVAYSYFTNTRNILDQIPMNSFSVKVIYWLDYTDLKKKESKKM
jgi:hypothetical protein